MKTVPTEVSPRNVLAKVAAAVPSDVHPNIVIIGSLAAGYWLFPRHGSFGVRTKDVDCVLSPQLSAVDKGRAVAEKLLAADGGPVPRATSASRETSTHLSTNYLRCACNPSNRFVLRQPTPMLGGRRPATPPRSCALDPQ